MEKYNVIKENTNIRLGFPMFYGFWIVLNALMARWARTGTNAGAGDFWWHNNRAEELLNLGIGGVHNLYHDAVALVSVVLGVEIFVSAGIVVFFMQMIFIVAIHFFAKHQLGEQYSDRWLLLVVAVTALAGSIPNLYSTNLLYFYGFGINVWHNPTTYTVMPFVIVSFFLFCYVLVQLNMKKSERMTVIISGRKKVDILYLNYILLSLSLVLSVYGKASWIPAFGLSALIFLICWWAVSKFSYSRLKECIFVGLAFIPASLYFLYISANSVYSVADFVFRLPTFVYLQPFPVMLNLIFPTFVLYITRGKLVGNRVHQIAWLTHVIAILQATFIVEYRNGVSYEGHGNLSWSIFYSLTILVMVSLIEFIKHIEENVTHKYISFTGLTLASVHLFSGIFYALGIWLGQGFWL